MNIFMYLRAEDGAALRDFLKRNPSVKGIEREKEFLLMNKDLQDEKSKELSIIYRAHKAMDYFIEEEGMQ